jgi:hypothetical protein
MAFACPGFTPSCYYCLGGKGMNRSSREGPLAWEEWSGTAAAGSGVKMPGRIRRRPGLPAKKQRRQLRTLLRTLFAPATARIDGEAIIENWWQRFITHLQNMPFCPWASERACAVASFLLVLFVPHREA